MSHTPPNAIIKDLYLEITNIAQGVNIAIFVYIIATRGFFSSLAENYFSAPFIAATSLLIVIIFWARYYLDTEIIDRSFTTLSVTWFFMYVVIQGISISFIADPVSWFSSTSVFLFFGVGFYFLNLRGIKRKNSAGVMPDCPKFIQWQTRRMIDLAVYYPPLVSLERCWLTAIRPLFFLSRSSLLELTWFRRGSPETTVDWASLRLACKPLPIVLRQILPVARTRFRGTESPFYSES